MAPGKRQVKARRHLVCNHCHSLVDFAVSGCGKNLVRDNGGRVYVPMFRVLESGLSDSRVS